MIWGRWQFSCLVGIVLFLAAGFFWEAGRVLLGDNLHEVLPGEIYRGAQRSPQDLEKLVKRHGIRTVVNLRGTTNSPWYVEQCRCIQELGIDQQDLNLSASRLPATQEMRKLVEILDKAEYPIFFHCRRGADRTGLVSVFAKVLKTQCGWEEARAQLNWRYGHVPYGRLGYIDQFFELYTDWLGKVGKPHSQEAFRHWVLHEYRGGTCNYKVADFQRIPGGSASARSCVKQGEPISYRVRLRNTGLGTWNITTHYRAGFHLGYRIWDMKGNVVLESRSIAMEERIAPGAVLDWTLVLPGLEPGKYWIMVDMVDEDQGWFHQMGSEPMEGELEVCE
jgi:protein tyrosine phosphatase (PTP) superfamily phosphohydrolase (DUF442 family)